MHKSVATTGFIARCLCFILVLSRSLDWGPPTVLSFVPKSWTPATYLQGEKMIVAVRSVKIPNNVANLKATQLKVFSAYDEDGYYDEEGGEDYDEEELTDEELAATMGEWDERIARFNTVHLTGRVGNNPEPRYFDDGKVVVNLNLATRCKYNGMERKALDIKPGEEETDWYGLEIWVSAQGHPALLLFVLHELMIRYC